MDDTRLVDAKGAAAILGKSERWILRHGQELPSVKIGKTRRFFPSSLIAWAKSREEGRE